MKNIELRSRFNLQLFADANTNTTSTASLSGEMKTFYNKTLIDLAEPELVHDQFADKYPIPANGGKTIEFRQYDSLPKATTPITEGVTPDGNTLSMHTITATVSQYGDYVTLSDVLKTTAIDNNVVQAVEALGSQAGRTMDTISRDALAGGSNVIFAGARADRDSLTSTDTLKPAYFYQAAAQLKAQNAPTINGSYVAIIHPYAAYDLMTSNDWIDINKYSAADKIFNGEIGKIGNVRFVEASEAKIWKDHTCPSTLAAAYESNKTYADVLIDGVAATSAQAVLDAKADGKKLTAASGELSSVVSFTGSVSAVFGTVVLGAKAYGTTDVEGLGMETIIKQLGAGDDPLNQRATVGWKVTKVTKRLVEQYMVRVESTSAYSSVANAN